MQESFQQLEELLLSGNEVNFELSKQLAIAVFGTLENWDFYQKWLQLLAFYRVALDRPQVQIIDLVLYMRRIGISLDRPNTEITVLPQAFEVCKNIVKRIHLQDSTIEDLGQGFEDYTLVEELSVRHSPLKELKPYLWTWKNLKKIDLLNCEISNIPPDIKYLTALEILKITSYNYVTIDQAICQLPNLQVLHYDVWDTIDLSNLCVQNTIPNSICRIPFLKNLHLNGGGKLAIPSNMNLPNLQKLACYEFNSEHFPIAFENLSQLTEVYISSCKSLDKLPEFLFQLPKLERLYLENIPLSLEDFETSIINFKSLKTLVYKQAFAYNRRATSKLKRDWEIKYPHIELYLLKF